MGISNLWIFILISISVDILLTLYYLKDCLHNPKISTKSRNKWVAIIVVFNILGSASYSYKTRKKNEAASTIKEIQIDRKIKDTIFLCLLFLFQLLSTASLFQISSNDPYLVLLIFSMLVYCLRYFAFPSCSSVLCYILAVVQIAAISYADFTLVVFDSKFIILVILAGIIIDYPLKFIKYFSPVPLIIFILFSVLKFRIVNPDVTSSSVIIYAVKNSITYTVFFSVIYIFKNQILLNYTLEKLMHELREKNMELEEISIIRERNRIAREIHDTIGHSLTGALVSLEAAKKLAGVDPVKTEELIEKSQSITREGFNDVKRALRALRPVSIEDNTLEKAILNIAERFEDDSDFSINANINIPDINNVEIKTSLYRIVQEIVTNCTRHSKATILNIDMESKGNIIRLNAGDNGKGCRQIMEGNGLRGIRERVEILGGDVYYNSASGEGFNTTIYIPMENHLKG